MPYIALSSLPRLFARLAAALLCLAATSCDLCYEAALANKQPLCTCEPPGALPAGLGDKLRQCPKLRVSPPSACMLGGCTSEGLRVVSLCTQALPACAPGLEGLFASGLAGCAMLAGEQCTPFTIAR